MSPDDRVHVVLFLAGLWGSTGVLCMLLSCGTQYWLLVSEEEDEDDEGLLLELSVHEKKASDGQGVRLFHEGLLWRCEFRGSPDLFSAWSFWIVNHPGVKVCEPAFLFPFPVLHQPRHSHHSAAHSAIVFRTFWSVFLIVGVATVVIGGFLVVCAAPLANHRLYKVGGAFQLLGGVCLLGVVLMFVMWIHVLDTLEVFAASQQSLSRGHPRQAYHRLAVHCGPSFLLAPVAGFFCLLSGALFIAAGRKLQPLQNK